MVNGFSLAITVVLFFSQSADLAAQNVSSRIQDVTLFSNQALISRQAEANAQIGLNEITLEIETFNIDPDSVTARVFGAGEIFGVQYKEVPTQKPPQENIKVILGKIEQLQREKQRRLDQKKGLQKNEAFLDAFIDFSKTQIPKELKTSFPDTEALNQTLSFLSSNYRKVYEEIQSIDMAVAEIDKELAVLKRELQMLRKPSGKARKVIEVLFNSAKAQKIKIQTEYLVSNAGWQPLYKASVTSLADAVDLTLFAKIMQLTGEDWNDVALSISNVIPLKGVRLPSLNSWMLDLPRPRRSSAGGAPRQAFKKSAPEMEMLAEAPAEDMEAEPAEFAQARKRKLPLSFEYAIGQKMTVESRKKETILPLFTKQVSGDYYHWAVPKQSPLTFLAANVKADKELLDGPLNVYFGGQYVGKTYLEAKRAGEMFNLSLGADREVVVKYEKLKDKVLETYFGMVDRNTTVRELAYKITMENLKDRAVTLKILDSVPVSKTDRIQVKDLAIKPEPTKRNYLDRQGVMLWEQTLKPGAKAEISIEFLLNYPKNFTPPIY